MSKATDQGTDHGGAVLRYLPPDAIRMDEESPTPLDPSAVEDMAASILKVGRVVEPVIVTAVPGTPDVFDLRIGRHRLAGARKAGAETIAALVYPHDDPVATALAKLVENIVRRSLNPIEEARHIFDCIEHQFTAKDVAEAVHRSESYVKGRLKLLQLPEAAQTAVIDGSVSVESATRILWPARQHPDLIEQAIEKGGNVAFTLREAVERRAAEADRDNKLAALQKEGKTAGTRDDARASGWIPLSRLDMTPKQHARMKCHAVVVDVPPHGRDAVLLDYCSDRSRHQTAGAQSNGSPSAQDEREAEKRRKAAEADEAARLDRENRRLAFARSAAQRVRLAGAELAVVVESLLAVTWGEDLGLVCHVLDLDLGERAEPTDAEDALRALAGESDTQARRVALALALAQASEDEGRYVGTLIALGYEPDTDESKHLQTHHPEALARATDTEAGERSRTEQAA